MKRALVRGSLLLLVAAGSPGFGCDDDDDAACAAGTTDRCFCPDGSELTQSCNASGEWDACPCGEDIDGDGYISEWERDPTVYGEWCDPASGLCWQNPERAARQMEMGWHQEAAAEYCESLVLLGHDDWRLPTIDEMRTLIRGCPYNETGGPCPVTAGADIAVFKPGGGETSPCMDSCFTEHAAGPGEGNCYWPEEMGSTCKRERSTSPKDYWSATYVEGSKEALGDEYYWYVFYGEGGAIGYNFKMSYAFNLCVRDAS